MTDVIYEFNNHIANCTRVQSVYRVLKVLCGISTLSGKLRYS